MGFLNSNITTAVHCSFGSCLQLFEGMRVQSCLGTLEHSMLGWTWHCWVEILWHSWRGTSLGWFLGLNNWLRQFVLEYKTILLPASLDWDVSTLFFRDGGALFDRDNCTLLLWNFLQLKTTNRNNNNSNNNRWYLAVLVLYEVAFLQVNRLTDVSGDLSGNILAALGGDPSADSAGHLRASVTSHWLALLLRNTLAILSRCDGALLHRDVFAGSEIEK